MPDDPERLSGLGVQEHDDIAMPSSQARLVHELHPAALLAAMGGDQIGPVRHERHYS